MLQICVFAFCEQKVFTFLKAIRAYILSPQSNISCLRKILRQRRKSWFRSRVYGDNEGVRPIKCRPIYLCRGGAQRGSRFKSAKCEQGAREGRRPSLYVLCSIYKDKYFTPFFIFVDKCASQDSIGFHVFTRECTVHSDLTISFMSRFLTGIPIYTI